VEVKNTPVNPIVQKSNDYMETLVGIIADITWKAKNRRNTRMMNLMTDLYNRKEISTLAPGKLDVEDIKTIILALKKKGNCADDLSHDISHLDALLKFCGYNTVDKCLRQYPALRPKKHYGRLPPMDSKVYRDLLAAWESADQDDFHTVRMYALVVLYMATGARNKELRLADVNHLNIEERTLFILHPKGEGSWGEPRTTMIMPEAVPIVERYMELRTAWLLQHRASTKALFFSLDGDKYQYISGNSTRVIKNQMQEIVHARFEYRDCRRWYAQTLIDMGLPIYAVSVLLGHASTNTTEMAYGRYKGGQALSEAKTLTEKKLPSCVEVSVD
jgi:integrase/recombinase XerD